MKFSVIFFLLLEEMMAAKILTIHHTPSRSHQILSQNLMLELAHSGHEITIVSPYPLKHPPKNYRDVVLNGLESYYDPYWESAFNHTEDFYNPVKLLFEFADETNDMANLTLNHPNVKKLLESKEKFDLMFIEVFGNDAFLGIAERFDCPVVAMSTVGLTTWANDLVTQPSPLSTVPNGLLWFTDKMSFWERMINIGFSLIDRLIIDYYYFPTQEKIFRAAFPNSKSSLRDLKRTKVSLLLLNSHLSIAYPRANAPNLIEVGGLQINPNPEPLPQDIAEFIDTAKNGVIFFSLGSNLKPSRIPKEKLAAIVASLEKTGMHIIWKWDDETLMAKSKRFFVRKWLPQDSILAHPRVKLFIFHGGLLSCTESIYHAVPMIGIPVFGDQLTNMNVVSASKWGIRLDYSNLTETSLDWAIQQVLKDPEYLINVEKSSRLLRDQPMTPLETAKYWVEYVIRHKGAHHLKVSSPGFIQYYNLDIFLLMGSVVAIVFVVIRLLIRKTFCKKVQNKEKLS